MLAHGQFQAGLRTSASTVAVEAMPEVEVALPSPRKPRQDQGRSLVRHRPTLLAKALTAICIAFPAGASAASTEVPFAGFALRIDPGPAYCQLDENAHEADRQTFAQQRHGNADHNEVVAIFAACSELKAFRRGEGMNRYAILLAPYVEGRLQPLRETARDAFLAAIGRRLSERELSIPTKKLNRRLNEFIDADTDWNRRGLTMSEPRQLGMLDKDDAAVYHGMVMENEIAGARFTTASVMGLTLIAGYPLQYGLYRSYVDETTITDLLAEIRPIMRFLADQNDPLGIAIPGEGSAQSRAESMTESAIESAVTGGVAALVIGVVLVLVQGIRRWIGRRERGTRRHDDSRSS